MSFNFLTIGLDFQSKNVQIDNQDVLLLLYDTARQEKFRALIPMYTRDDDINLLVYDISCRDLHLSDWFKDLNNIKKDEVILALVGNKIDLSKKREVNIEEGKDSQKKMILFLKKLMLRLGMDFLIYFIKICLKKLELSLDLWENSLH